MIDEILTDTIPENVSLRAITMLYEKKIFLIYAREEDKAKQRSYARSILIMVGNELVTSNYADTMLLFSEIKLFDYGNKQNRFTTIEKFDGDINLKLKLSTGHVYLSKAEAATMLVIYAESKMGISLQRLLNFELRFTRETLVRFLSQSGFLEKPRN